MIYTTIQLSKEDAEAFIKFQKHYAMVNLLESLGVFDLRNASIEMHFDSLGQIAKIDTHTHYYRPKTVDNFALPKV